VWNETDITGIANHHPFASGLQIRKIWYFKSETLSWRSKLIYGPLMGIEYPKDM
jgi:hypothetical protein